MIDTTPAFPRFRAVVDAYARLSAHTLRLASLALRRRLIELPMTAITDEFAFALPPQGWNYLSAVLAEYERQPDIAPERSTYYRFFQHPRVSQVRSLSDVLYLHDPTGCGARGLVPFELGTYPWGGLNEAETRMGGTPFGWHHDQATGAMTRDLWGYKRALWYKPDDHETLHVEWYQTIHNLIALKEGYRPLLHGSVPSVCLLVRRDGEVRGVMGDGHHRLVVLNHLGVARVTVAVVQRVEERRVDDWHHVRSGRCNREQALQIFHAFFALNGKERLAALGL